MEKIKMAIEEIYVAEFYVDVDETTADEDISDVAIEKAKTLYDAFTSFLVEEGITVEEGIFQAEMMVEISNDGPVTILMDSKKVF